MGAAAVLFSCWPVTLDAELSSGGAFGFNAALSAGRTTGGLLLALALWPGLLRHAGAVCATVAGWLRARDGAPLLRRCVLLGVLSHFAHVPFAAATRYVDTATVMVLHEAQILLTIVVLQHLFRDPEHGRRFARLRRLDLLCLGAALAGVALVVYGGQRPATAYAATAGGGVGLAVGVGLALLSAALAACHAYGMRWGAALYLALAPGNHDTRREVSCMLLAYALSSVVALPVSAALAALSGETYAGGMAHTALAGCALFATAHALQRVAVTRTHSLGVLALGWLTTPLALLWLVLGTDVLVLSSGMVVGGTGLIVAGNAVLAASARTSLGHDLPRRGH